MAKKHPLPRPVPQFCDFNEKVPDLYVIWWVFPLPTFFLSEKFLCNVADKQPGKQAFKKPTCLIHLAHHLPLTTITAKKKIVRHISAGITTKTQFTRRLGVKCK